jgi:hypothetical protein
MSNLLPLSLLSFSSSPRFTIHPSPSPIAHRPVSLLLPYNLPRFCPVFPLLPYPFPFFSPSLLVPTSPSPPSPLSLPSPPRPQRPRLWTKKLGARKWEFGSGARNDRISWGIQRGSNKQNTKIRSVGGRPPLPFS